MDKLLVTLFLICMSHFGHAQKLVRKAVLNPDTESILIDGSHCFQIDLHTHIGNEVTVKAQMEGEYAKDLAIRIDNQGKAIHISAGFLPSFKLPNDKLGAHKVLSIALMISIPKFIFVEINGTNTNVAAMGEYKSLGITLNDGNVTLGPITESVSVKTQKGGIVVEKAMGQIEATSKFGKVLKGKVPNGDQSYHLYSVEGDIFINQGNG